MKRDFKLEQNYLNPFNPTTKMCFSIPKGIIVTLKVCDVTGKEVMTLINEYKPKGIYEVSSMRTISEVEFIFIT